MDAPKFSKSDETGMEFGSVDSEACGAEAIGEMGVTGVVGAGVLGAIGATGATGRDA